MQFPSVSETPWGSTSVFPAKGVHFHDSRDTIILRDRNIAPGLLRDTQGLECSMQRCWELRAGQSCRDGREGEAFLLCDGESSPEDLSSCSLNKRRRLCPPSTKKLEMLV